MANSLIAYLIPSILYLFAGIHSSIGNIVTEITPAKQIEIKDPEPLKIAIVGLSHDHVNGILRRKDQGDIKIVAIVESNRDLAKKYSDRYGYSMDLVYPSLEEMFEKEQPEAVTAFNSIYDHLAVVEFCAPKGIHVMVEKPLATSYENAQKMVDLAKTHQIQLLTNYETTWYGSNWQAYDLIHKKQEIGPIRKMVFYTGHQGPKEIGCSNEFLDWLTDPVLNGAGALNDFGCYGSNLSTWFLKGETPNTVTAITKQVKPDIYPKVDDDATIILNYDDAEVIIQASWNWPFGRKEMEIYGQTGYVFCKNGRDMKLLVEEKSGPSETKADDLPNDRSDPFHYLYQVIREGYSQPAFDLSSVENNLIVVQILHAAKESAKLGRTVNWQELYP